MGYLIRLELAALCLIIASLLAPSGASLKMEDPLVYPREVERGEKVLITVVVIDENNTPPLSVQVWVGGRWWEMSPVEGDGNYTKGVIYGAEVPLESSIDKVVFQAVDSDGEQHTMIYNITVAVRKGSTLSRYFCYAGIGLFLLLVALTVVSRLRGPRTAQPPQRLPESGEALCSSCGRVVPQDAAICPYCGERFVEEEHVCPRCGKSLSPSDTVCPRCGTKLEPVYPVTDTDLLKLSSPQEAEGKKECPHCGAVLLEGMRTCPGCGRVIEEPRGEKDS